jgi:type IV pilus assembly protein PilN
VYLTGVKQTDKKLKFEGVAQSSTRVSAFMRNLDGSEYLKNPELEVVETGKAAGGSSFTLYAEEITATAPDEQKSPGKRARKVVASRGTGP